jgi:hypothetical protein
MNNKTEYNKRKGLRDISQTLLENIVIANSIIGVKYVKLLLKENSINRDLRSIFARQGSSILGA